MGLFSLFRKNKQDSASDDGEFFTRTEDESNALRGKGRRGQRKQSSQTVDPALPEKKRARRRLVGAVALVLAAVIVLPMVLDSEPKPLAEDIAIQIPSKDNPAARPADTRSGTPANSETEAPVPPSAGLDKGDAVIQPSLAPVAPEKNTAAVTPAPATANKSEPPQKLTSKVENKVTVQQIPSGKPDDSERARAILEGGVLAKADSDATANNAKQSAYLVQVAALASQDRVNELRTRLKNAGIKSHTEKVATANGERIRIRVGPFANKEEADRMRARIAKLGLNGTLVPA